MKKSALPSVAAVIFDFDGLMIDTESPAFGAWSAIYQDHGVTLELDRWVACVGTDGGFDPVEHLATLTGRSLNREELIADKERRKKATCDQLPLLPGVREKIAEARLLGLKLAVASSSASTWVRGYLVRHNLNTTFDAIRTREDVARVKPHPDLYHSAAAALGVAAASCLVFEDSLNGVRAAKAAGARCIAVPGPITKGLDFAAADRVLESLLDAKLADLLA